MQPSALPTPLRGVGLALSFLLPTVLVPTAASAQAGPTVLDTIPVVGSRVSASLPVNSRAIQSFDREALEALPASTVADALRWALGVEIGMRSPAQADLSIRGGGFENVLVMVDGMRMSDPQTGHFDLNLTLPLEGVERIEILRGPASALYGGDAVGGVVNVVRRNPAAWELAVEGGSFGTLRGTIQGGISLPGGSLGTLSLEEGRSDGHREGTDWDHRLMNFGLATPALGGRLRGDVGRASRDFGAAGFYSPHPSFESTTATTASVRWHPAPGTRIGLEPRLAWRSHDDDFILIREDPAVYRNQHTSTQWTGDLVARAEMGAGVGMAAGAEFRRNSLESNSLGSRSEDRRSVFAEVAWEAGQGTPGAAGDIVSGKLGGTIGLRYDDHEAWDGAVSPSVSGFLALAPALRLRGSWGRAFRGASWTERYYEDPAHSARADLDPERSESVDFAAVLTAIPGGELSMGAFRRSSRDLIDWARPAGEEEAVWETRNVSRAVFRGIEIEGRWTPGVSLGRIGGGGLRISGGLSFLTIDADVEPGLESKYALRPLTEEINAGLTRDLVAGVRGSLRLLHARRPGEAGHREVDLRLERSLLDGRAHVELRNLTDSDHLDLTGHPVRGRSVVLGYAVTLR